MNTYDLWKTTPPPTTVETRVEEKLTDMDDRQIAEDCLNRLDQLPVMARRAIYAALEDYYVNNEEEI